MNIDFFKLTHNRTLLGAGPMSKNVVDCVIEVSNSRSVPIMLIASRRQIDSEEFGGGYVNNWSTSQFCNYVRGKDKKRSVILCRDHGGPWQNSVEVNSNLSLSAALDSCKNSFKNDIDAGMQVLHLDPSIDIHGVPSHEEVIDRLFDLYSFCYSYAKSKGKQIYFEVGTEEQSAGTNYLHNLEDTLNALEHFTLAEQIPKPTFVVAQTGTKVMETRNIGTMTSPVRVREQIPPELLITKVLEKCTNHNLLLKEHNCDYLPLAALRWHPRVGIHAANVAPEFGVVETRALLKIFDASNLHSYSKEFIDISLQSGKWSKWLIPHSRIDEREKAVIAGHYCFSMPEFIELKKFAKKELKSKGIDLDKYLRECITGSLLKYLNSFNCIK